MGLKFLTRLRLGRSYLNEYRFNFQSFTDPLCSCSLKIKSTTDFLLHCHHFSDIRSTLLNNIHEVLSSTTNLNDNTLILIILRFEDQN